MRIARCRVRDLFGLKEAEEPAIAILSVRADDGRRSDIALRKLMASWMVSSINVGPAGSSIMAAATSSDAISG